MRAPVFGARAKCASARFASRRANGTSIPPRHCEAFVTCCAMMRSSQCFAAAAVRGPRVRAPCAGQFLVCARSAR
eukprot:2823421-Lingulodinium_polyedra.AAC.1